MLEMSWPEYQLAERFVQNNPWYWQMVLKGDDEEEESPILGPDGKPVPKPPAEKKVKPKSKKKRDEEYRRLVVEETTGAGSRNSYD